MHKNRLEAFSDGVIAIIITIMVLEIKIPHGNNWTDLKPLLPVVLVYMLSFINVGIYWNNHHHLWYVARKVNGNVMWANLHLLFWLSLIPFVTGWMGENHFSSWPVALYGFVLLMAGVAWYILAHFMIRLHGTDSPLARAYGKDTKGKISVYIYLAAVVLSFLWPWMSLALYSLVSLTWFIPDKRIVRELSLNEKPSGTLDQERPGP